MKEKLFKTAVVYQIYPRSFKDSNGDGIGDIPGIISKLDYLKDLGVEIIWLSPIYKTSNKDYGYDISDYYSINPEYGTMEDFDCLLKEAKKRGLRIVMDLVVNHTSSDHPWFKASIDRNSKYHDYYIWQDGKDNNQNPPNNWTSNFTGSAWKFCPENNQWYLHLFHEDQPDLNWHNPLVLEEVKKILKFYLDKGVYGFRCDVINEIYKETYKDGKKGLLVVGAEHYLNSEGCHKILKELYNDVFSKYDSVVIGETYNIDYRNARRFLNGEMDLLFQFDTMNCDVIKVPILRTKRWRKKFKESLFAWQKEVDWNAIYLENHDQRRSVSRFGDVKNYHKQSAKMLATILLTLKGTPFIYQGEEIGMTDYPMFTPSQYKDPVNHFLFKMMKKYRITDKLTLKLIQNNNRDNARLPFQWDNSLAGGFSSNIDTWLPVNPNYSEINALDEEEDPNSILNYYKKLIALRRADPVLLKGTLEKCRTSNKIMCYYRIIEKDVRFILVNLTNKRIALPKWIRKIRGQVIISNYEGAGLTFKKFLRPYESLVAKIS